MCWTPYDNRNSSAQADATGIYDAGEALAVDALEDATGGPFTDEEYASTDHFDLTLTQQALTTGALGLVGQMLKAPEKLAMAIALGLIDKTAFRALFIEPRAATVDDIQPWPPTVADLERVTRAVGELGLQFTNSIIRQLGIK